MRFWSLMSLFLVVFVGCATVGDIEPDRYELTYEVEFPGVEQQTLHEEARRYFAWSFESAQDVIQYERSEDGKGEIIGNGTTSYFSRIRAYSRIHRHTLRFTMNVRSREGLVQIRFGNLEGFGTVGFTEREYKAFSETQYENVQDTLEGIVDDFRTSVSRELKDDF